MNVPNDSGDGRDLAFVSYSHLDKEWLPRVLTLLKPYVRSGQLQVWADPYVEVGDRWERKIEEALARARVAVLLVSQHFFASDFIDEKELPPLLADAVTDSVRLFCVPVSSVDAALPRMGELRRYQWARPPEQPLDLLSGGELNRALVEVAAALAAMFPEPVAEKVPLASRREPATPVRAPAGASLGAMHGVPELPPHFLQRGAASSSLKAALLDLNRPSVGVSAARGTGLHGLGGIGKSVLAAAVACDDEVRRAFRDGIYWVTLGQQPNVLSLQQELLEAVTVERTALESATVATKRLRQVLEQRNCLLVLDDAWELEPLQAFDVLGAQGRLLVTTRDAQLLTAVGAHTHSVEVLAAEDAQQLLVQWSGATTPLPPEAARVAEECGYLPLALALAAAQVRDGSSWEQVNVALAEGKLEFLDHPYGSVFKSLSASIRALPETEGARYRELAIFPEDTAVPEELIVQLWLGAGLDDTAAHKLLRKLASRALLTLSDDGARKLVTFHDLQRDYLQLVAEDLPGMHARLLVACLDPSPERWAELPTTASYLWRWLGYHLLQAGRRSVLEVLLVDYRWLTAKLAATDVNALVAEYDRLAPGRHEPLGLVRDALVLSSHVITPRPEELPTQLIGRLGSEEAPQLCALVEAARSAVRPPALVPVWPRLTAPGGPLLRTLEGHQHWVVAVAISPDGTTCVSGSKDTTLGVWDLASGKLLRSLEGHGHGVNAVAISPDGKTCVSGSSDETLKIWDLASGQLLRSLKGHHEPVTVVAISPDGKTCVSGSHDKTLKVWDLASGTLLRSLEGHQRSVAALAIGADGTTCVSGSWDKVLKVWDLASGRLLRHLDGQQDSAAAVVISPDGKICVSSSSDQTLNVWDLASGRLLRSLRGHRGVVNAVAISPDGKTCVSGSSDQTLKVWDLASGELVRSLEGHQDRINAVAIGPDGKTCVSGSWDKTLKVWDLAPGRVVRLLDSHQNRVAAVALSRDCATCVSGSWDGTLKVWDLASGQLVRSLQSDPNSFTAVAISPEGNSCVSGSYARALQVWDLSSGKVLCSLKGHQDNVVAAAISPDGKIYVSGSHDQTLKVWDVASGQLLRSLESHEDRVNAVAIGVDGKSCVSGSWDATLKVWDLASGQLLRTLRGHETSVAAVAMSPDGKTCVSASFDFTLRIWDLASGELLRTLEGHQSRVYAVGMSLDGKICVSASSDKTLKLWDLASGEILASFTGDGSFHCVALGADGGHVVAGDGLGRLHLLAIRRS